MRTPEERERGEEGPKDDAIYISFDMKKIFNWIRKKMKFIVSLFMLFLIPFAYGQECYTSAHNMVGYSEDMTSATGWTKVATMADTSSTVPAPVSKFNVGKTFSATLTAGQSNIIYGSGSNVAILDASPYRYSIFAKYGTRQFIGLGVVGGATHGCSFDIQNGIAGVCNGLFTSPTIVSAGGGWYKLSVLHTGVYATFPAVRLGITNQTSVAAFTVLAATGGEIVYLSSPQVQNVVTGMSSREQSKYVPQALFGIAWAPASTECDITRKW